MDSLEGSESVTEPSDIGGDELIRTVDSAVEGDDLVKVVFGGEVEVVHVASQAGSEGDRQLLLKVADHAVGVDAGDGEGEPVHQPLSESLPVCRDLSRPQSVPSFTDYLATRLTRSPTSFPSS